MKQSSETSVRARSARGRGARRAHAATPERDHELGHQLDDRILNDRFGAAGPSPMGAPVDERAFVVRELDNLGPRIRRRVTALRARLPKGFDLESALAFAAFAMATAGAAAIGSRAYPRRRLSRSAIWYRRLDKPAYNPPDWVFGPVWSTLYALIATSGWRIWRTSRAGLRPRTRTAALALWAAQLGLNAIWSHAFFGRRRPRLALADLALMLVTTGGYTALARTLDRPAAWMMAPYMAWTSFAGVLTADILRRNR